MNTANTGSNEPSNLRRIANVFRHSVVDDRTTRADTSSNNTGGGYTSAPGSRGSVSSPAETQDVVSPTVCENTHCKGRWCHTDW